MTKNIDSSGQTTPKSAGRKPSFNIRKIGIVTRDYTDTFDNGCKDFSDSLPKVLKVLDEK